jgi:hypothetical protein
MRVGVLLACLLAIALSASAAAAEPARITLRAYLESLHEHGTRVVFSSDLVTDDMVIDEPASDSDPLAVLREILPTYGLHLEDGPAGAFLVVRAPVPPTVAPKPAPAIEAPIPEIVVTSSLHRLQYSEPQAHTYFERDLAARMPTTGDEIVRLTNRLPGTANGGISSRNHVRGGEENEVLFLFDGLRLYEPYHLRDFQSVATIVNSAAVGGIDFFTGAYPARYGDRMSGVMIMDMREAPEAGVTELALSFFNASMLSMGRFGGGDAGEWLVSARRGNLDLIADVIDPDIGHPDYNDVLAHFAWDFGPRARVSANALVSQDKIGLSERDRGEVAGASYTNHVGWIRWDADWTGSLSSRTILAASDIEDRRDGSVELPGIVSGALDDQQDLHAFEVRQDWTWVLSDRWMWRFGANLKHVDADYVHVSDRTIEAAFAAALGNAEQRHLDFDISADGAQYAAYSEVRWRMTRHLVLDLGLRWDQQTYPIADNDRQYSPRASLLWQPSGKTEIRFGWGQFYQAQETNELQLSDGISNFFPAQRAEHFVLHARRWLGTATSLDVSLFRKSFRTLRPRFENMFDTLTLVPELQFDRVMIDPRKAESIGAEITVTRAGDDDDPVWWASYSWARIRDWIEDERIERSWDQTHSLKAGAVVALGAWDLSAAIDIHSGWPRSELRGDPVAGLQASGRNQFRHPTFATLDVRFSRDIEVRKGTLTAYLDITNLLNRQNPCCTEYSLDAEGQLAARTAHWLPLVPSVGVVWTF